MRQFLKKIVLTFTPQIILGFLKRRYYVRALKEFDETQERDLEVVKNIVRAGDYVVDAGANVGWYTKVLSELVGTSGRVFSIEPIPPTFSLLRHAVKVLALRNVQLYELGVSQAEAVVTMEVPRYSDGGANFYMSRITDSSPVTDVANSAVAYSVKVSTLDTVLSGFEDRIDFIKCDVEGHEWQAIQGACGVIERSQPAWLLEVSGDPDQMGSSANLVVSFLLGKGYEAFWYDGKRLQRREPGQSSVNYFFLAPKHLKRVAELNPQIVAS